MNTATAAQPLQGRTALVVQADSGVGAAVAEAFAAAGARVMINYRHDSAGADRIAQGIRAKQGQAMIFQADISRESQVKSMFDVLIAYWGGLDILVTNADLAMADSARNMDREQWRKIHTQNLTGQFLCVRQAMRVFLRQGSQGTSANSPANIICVSTLQDVLNPGGQFNYAVCKTEMSGLFKTFTSALSQENTGIELHATNELSLNGYCHAHQALAIDSGSATLMSRNQQDIAKTAVGLAEVASVKASDEFE